MEERELLGVFLETGHFPAIPVGLTKLPRLAYMSLVDFVPDTPPYKFLTVVELEPANGGVQVMMTVDSMHDQVWTERLLGRGAGTNSTISPHSSRAVADGGDDFSEGRRS